MKKFSISMIALSAMIMTACGAAPANDADAQEAVHDAMHALSDNMSGEFNLSFDGDVSALEGAEGMVFDMEMSGAYDNSERNAPKLSFALNGSGALNDDPEEGIDVELRMTDGAMYFVVNEVSSFGGEIPMEMVAPFLGQWFYMEMPPEFSDAFATYSGDEAELTEEEKAIKDLFLETKFFTNVSDKGGDKVDGVDTTKYSVELDKEATRNYLIESSKLAGVEPTETEIEEMDMVMEALTFTGFVWVDGDGAMKQLAGDLEIGTIEEVDSVEVSMTYTMNNLGGEITVEVPEGAELFDPFALMMGGAAMSEF